MDKTTLWQNLIDRAKYLESKSLGCEGRMAKIPDLDMTRKPEIIFAIVNELERLQREIDELKG